MCFPSVWSIPRRSSLPLHSEVSLLLPGKLNSRSFVKKMHAHSFLFSKKETTFISPLPLSRCVFNFNSNTLAPCSSIFWHTNKKKKKSNQRNRPHPPIDLEPRMNPHLEKVTKNRTRETRRTNELHIRFLSLSVKTDRIIFETKQTTTYRGKKTNFRDRKRDKSC